MKIEYKGLSGFSFLHKKRITNNKTNAENDAYCFNPDKNLTEEESRKILLLLDNVIYKIEKQIENYIKSEVKNVEYKD